MSNREKLNQIRHTAAAILAHAVIDFDSKAFRLKGEATPWGFYYDFIFVNPFGKEVLPFIEERMRQIIAKNEEIKIYEMVPVSAASFMHHHHHPYAAHFIEMSPDPLVKVIQMGSFVDHVHEAFLDRTGELLAFKILKLEERSDLYFKGKKKRVIRIIGVADESKEALKDFLKKNKKKIGVDHLAIGSEMGLFKVDIYRDQNFLEKGRIYWTREGEALLHNIYEYWRKLHLKEKFELVVTNGPQITSEHQKLYQLESKSCEERPVQYAEYRRLALDGEFSLEMGLLLAKDCHKDLSHIFCLKKDLLAVLTSSLLFLNQLPELLEHHCSLTIIGSEALLPILKKGAETIDLKKDVSKGKESRIEWNIHDDFGRTFQGPFLMISEKNEIFTIKSSLFPSVERMIAIILELHEKDLSQKKELLSRMDILANLRINELEN